MTWVAMALTWAVLGWVVAWGAGQIREQVREQIVRRDGQILAAMAKVQAVEAGEEPDLESELKEEPWSVFMHVAGREGIVASWLFDPRGEVEATIPLAVREGAVPQEARALLAGGQAFSRFRPAMPLAEVFLDPRWIEEAGWGATIPVVEVYVPVKGEAGGGMGWVAGFLIEASSVVQEFERLDRQLAVQGLGLQGVAMGITGVTLGWVFRRLNRARRLLERRTEDLMRANQELLRSARIAALGAVTAHLVHGLKNPVSGLQSFVASRADGEGEGSEDWREAKAATQRMQALIQDVVDVIREREFELGYEVPMVEVGQSVLRRAGGTAERRKIRLSLDGAPKRMLDNRTSGLLALMLGNLVENAIEATPEGGTVRLHLREERERTVCDVVDEGPGLSSEAKARLFQPQSSSKEGGTGVGLAITRQMALAMGGDVRLAGSDLRGTVFRVELPWEPAEGARQDMGRAPAGKADGAGL